MKSQWKRPLLTALLLGSALPCMVDRQARADFLLALAEPEAPKDGGGGRRGSRGDGANPNGPLPAGTPSFLEGDPLAGPSGGGSFAELDFCSGP
jgi:hypothetical protein